VDDPDALAVTAVSRVLFHQKGTVLQSFKIWGAEVADNYVSDGH